MLRRILKSPAPAVLPNYAYRLVQRTVSNVKSLMPDEVDYSPPKRINFAQLQFESKVPQQPCPLSRHFKSHRTEIDHQTLKLLERLSLVNVSDSEAFRTLEDSIEFASKILDIDTDNVQPLYTVLEDQPLQMRADCVTDGDCQQEILRNARITEEEYFVAPPGNIPLNQLDQEDDGRR